MSLEGDKKKQSRDMNNRKQMDFGEIEENYKM